MAQTTYNLNIVADGTSHVYRLDERVLKGTVDVTLNFAISSAGYDVVKIRVFQKGKQLQLFEGSRIPKTINYTAQPSYAEYLKLDITFVTVYYSNFESVEYVIPIYVAQPSLYSDFSGMRAIGAQFLDTKDAGDTFVIMQTHDGNIHHMVLYANEITPSSAAPLPLNVVAAVSAAWNVDPAPVVTQQNTYIEAV